MRTVILAAVIAAVAICAGVVASVTAPANSEQLLVGRLQATDASLAGTTWSSAGAPAALEETTLPARLQCELPTPPLFGSVLANAQFGSRASGDQLSETLGIATTSDLNAAVQLLRGAVTWTETCTRQATTPQPIPSRAVYSIYLNEVQQFTDFVSGWKGPSYSPPRPFVPPPIPLGTVVAEKGVRFGPHFLRITYTVLRDGYIAQIIVSGPTAPRDLPLLLTRLTTAL